MLNSIETPEFLLERARSGDTEAFGQLLTQYHNYLRLMARALARAARSSCDVDSSDLVQEAFLEAHRDFPQFCRLDRSGAARVAAADSGAQPRRPGPVRSKPGVRDHRRQQVAGIAARSKSSLVDAGRPRRHRDDRRAPRRPGASGPCFWPTHSRACLRTIARWSSCGTWRVSKFSEVAARMGRSSGAVRMLWARAIERLSEALEGPGMSVERTTLRLEDRPDGRARTTS